MAVYVSLYKSHPANDKHSLGGST